MSLRLVIEGTSFLLGLLFGSFLNVCIARVPAGESVVRPGSRCMRCGHAIRWFDNVPVVSWMLLRGRCRDCGAAISASYPGVEMGVGLWFLVCGARLSSSGPGVGVNGYLQAVGLAVLGWLLIGLIVIDWRIFRLPDAFTWGGMVFAFFLVCLQAIFLGPEEDQVLLHSAQQLRLRSPGSFVSKGNVFLTGPEALIFGRIAAAVGLALLLLGIRWGYRRLRGKEGLGLGDVKMMAMVGAFLGFWPGVLTLFVGVMLGAGYGVTLLLRRRAGAGTPLPLGSFLGVAGLAVAVFGDAVLGWYRGLL